MASLPTRAYAGITVPNTALVNKALVFARARLSDAVYNHVVRSWLFGFAIASKAPELQDRDLEVHSISAILHDMGWDTTGELVSNDKRFEVDGADAARLSLQREAVEGEWDAHRLQLVWDAIALHTTRSIAWYKEPEVIATSCGIYADFVGPERAFGGHLTWQEYKTIIEELPRLGVKEGLREAMCKLCRTKPETTYDNIAGQYGERFVEGYSLAGHRQVDLLEGYTLP